MSKEKKLQKKIAKKINKMKNVSLRHFIFVASLGPRFYFFDNSGQVPEYKYQIDKSGYAKLISTEVGLNFRQAEYFIDEFCNESSGYSPYDVGYDVAWSTDYKNFKHIK